MKESLKISFIQADIAWENVEVNLSYFENEIQKIGQTDIIVLPEMFNTGFSMKPEKTAETMDGKTIDWLRNTASKKKCAIIGSLAIKEANRFFNRLIFSFPDGNISFYNKKHLFVLSDEHKKFTAGSNLLLVDYLGWKIKPLICYDLRFPVWARNVEDYDLLIYIANWPSSRSVQWKLLLKARAIENQSYTLGVNRIGKDENNYVYSGDTLLISPIGKELCNAEDEETTRTIEINKSWLNEARAHFPVLKDRDNFDL